MSLPSYLMSTCLSFLKARLNHILTYGSKRYNLLHERVRVRNLKRIIVFIDKSNLHP